METAVDAAVRGGDRPAVEVRGAGRRGAGAEGAGVQRRLV